MDLELKLLRQNITYPKVKKELPDSIVVLKHTHKKKLNRKCKTGVLKVIVRYI